MMRATPKSVSFASCAGVAGCSGTRMFDGFTTRWTTHSAWAWASAPHGAEPAGPEAAMEAVAIEDQRALIDVAPAARAPAILDPDRCVTLGRGVSLGRWARIAEAVSFGRGALDRGNPFRRLARRGR